MARLYSVTRGLMTLQGAAAAAVLLWLAAQLDVGSNGAYWAWVALSAAAGFAIALSQLLGGWTKWGWPRVDREVFLLGVLPALVAGGWLLAASQPDSSWFREKAADWADYWHLGGAFDDLTAVLPAIAFGLGLLLGLVLDTTGPRDRTKDAPDADERPPAERSAVVAGPTEVREPVRGTSAPDRPVEIREGGTPAGPQPERPDRQRPDPD